MTLTHVDLKTGPKDTIRLVVSSMYRDDVHLFLQKGICITTEMEFLKRLQKGIDRFLKMNREQRYQKGVEV